MLLAGKHIEIGRNLEKSRSSQAFHFEKAIHAFLSSKGIEPTPEIVGQWMASLRMGGGAGSLEPGLHELERLYDDYVGRNAATPAVEASAPSPPAVEAMLEPAPPRPQQEAETGGGRPPVR